MSDEAYVQIRAALGELIGSTIIDITQHDQEEFEDEGLAVIYLHLSNGKTLFFSWDGIASDEVEFGLFE